MVVLFFFRNFSDEKVIQVYIGNFPYTASQVSSLAYKQSCGASPGFLFQIGIMITLL